MALRNNEKSALADELALKKTEENYVQGKVNIDKKMATVPFLRYCLKQQKETDEEKKDEVQKLHANLREAKLRREEDFAYQMRKMKDEELKEQKLRQDLRINCPELKELEDKLKVAYTAKVLQGQIMEKKARTLRDKEKEMSDWKVLMDAHIRDEEHWKQLKEKKVLEQEHYRKEIQDQMIFQEKTKRAQYEEFLKEKKLVDELVNRILEEDHREMQQKYYNIMKTQEDIRAFKEVQEKWRQKARKRIEMEDRQINEYIRLKIEQEHKVAQENAYKRQQRDLLADETAKKIYRERREKDEKEAIIMELTLAEEREKHEKRHRDECEKRLREKLEMDAGLSAQMREKQDRIKKEQEEDAAYKQALIDKMYEDEKLEQLSNENRRRKLMQFRRDIDEMIKAKRLQRTMENQLRRNIQEEMKKEAEKRQQIIDDERLRILREHAENLIGYFPPGLFKDGELEKLGEDIAMKVKCKKQF